MTDESKFFSYNPYNDSYTRLCKVYGICTKSHAEEAIEEYLFQGLKYLSFYAKKIEEYQKVPEIFFDVVVNVLFSSIKNVEIDKQEVEAILQEIQKTERELKSIYKELMKQNNKQMDILTKENRWHLTYKVNEYILEGEKLINLKAKLFSREKSGLYELLTVCLKGIAKTVIQTKSFGIINDEINKFFLDILFELTKKPTKAQMKEMLLECGKVNIQAVNELKKALKERYGYIEKTKVRISPIKGKAILVSGRDIKQLEDILRFTVSEKINIYTHGEMLYAHTLPEITKFENLAGHYGGVSTDQQLELEHFPGPIFMTSDCSWNPPEVFRGRLFTSGLPNLAGIKQIANQEYNELIKAAQDSEGFLEDAETQYIEVGFDEERFKKYMEDIEDNIQKGVIDEVFLLAGCSNSNVRKKYIDKFIKNLPPKSILIKFSGLQYDYPADIQNIDDIPKILDFGMFNDLFFIIKFFEKSDHLNINLIKSKDFSMIFFLREQSSVVMLFSVYILCNQLKNIKIGACSSFSMLSPNIFKAMEQNFDIKTVTSAKADIEYFMKS